MSEQSFSAHVKEGLSLRPKKLSSRYFYDAQGDRLFQQIMQSDEYYLPRCEMDIIMHESPVIARDIAHRQPQNLQIVELGAGDGSKTVHLLKAFSHVFEHLEYLALDISQHILDINHKQVSSHLPAIETDNIAGNYFETYPTLPDTPSGRLVLFLGANIGNYDLPDAIKFLQFIRHKLHSRDYILVAFDLIKNPRKIISAYDDREGITRAFNLNLLTRMNRELGAEFDLSKFDHYPYYNPLTGITASHLISLEKQTISFADGFQASFEAYEAIQTEISKKYFPQDIELLAIQSEMKIAKTYYDSGIEYAFVLFTPQL